MKEKLISLFTEHKFLNIDEIKEYIKDDKAILEEALSSLINEHLIYKNKKGNYGLLESFNYYLGTVELKKKGYGFFKSDKLDRDVFIPMLDLDNALDGDTVIVWINPSLTGDKYEGKVVKVVKHNNDLICRVEHKFHHFDNKVLKCDMYPDVKIEVDDFKDASIGDLVSVKVKDVDLIKKNTIYVDIVNLIGNESDSDIDLKALIYKYGLVDYFKKEVCDNVEEVRLKYEKDKNSIKRRYVDRDIITIDGADALDLDDAVSAKRLDNGNYFLGVYIADVSYFVEKDSYIDKEALSRGTSVYIIDKVVPMLPETLSNDLCSLNENTSKFVMALEMEVDKYGHVIDSDIFEAVIKTKYRMTYDNVQVLIDYLKSSDKENFERMDVVNKYASILDMIQDMKDLSSILTNMKKKRGSLDFDIPEAKFITNDEGKILDVVAREANLATKIIEDFMICANETVAEMVAGMSLPFIYRIHDKPVSLKIARFKKVLSNTKYSLRRSKNDLSAYEIQDLLASLDKDDIVVKENILKMMAKAKYASYNIGHFGLASKCYTHFTSPIRRYPDLLVHRLIRKYILNSEEFYQNYSDVEMKKLIEDIDRIADISTNAEINANNCEFEADDMKKAEYMEGRIGEVFDAKIVSIISSGFFVVLENTIEGLVSIKDLKDDRYYYSEEKGYLIGTRYNRIYKIGDKLKVVCTYANKQDREINFIPQSLYLKNKSNVVKYKRK